MWDKSVPTSGTNIVEISSIHKANWSAFETAFSDEHYTFSSALSGIHKPGQTSVVSAGPTSAVSAISDSTSGALVWDETLGLGKICVTGWEQANMLPLSRVFVYRATDHTVPASGITGSGISNPELIPFDTESKDTLSEYDNSTYTFTASATGWYLVSGRVSVSTAVASVLVTSYISVRNSSDVEQYTLGEFTRYTSSPDECPMLINELVYLTVGQKIRVYIYHDYSSSITLEGGANISFLKIYRVS